MSNTCTVLMYHVVGDPLGAGEARQCCPLPAFRAQMACLADGGWNVIPLADCVRWLAGGGALPDRAVVITFDDGTACTRDAALPVLQQHGFPATVFMVAGLVGGRNEWMCQAGGTERRMLTAAQLREMAAAGVEIGSHAFDHRHLAGRPAGELAHEARDSKARLEDLTGAPVRHFAYPYGSHDAATVAAVREAGYAAACSTIMGRNHRGADLFALRRTEVMGGDALWQFRLKLRAGTHDMPPWSLLRSTARRTLVSAGLMTARR